MTFLATVTAHWPPGHHWIWGIVTFLYGAAIGSFLNVCIWRMPREETVLRPLWSRCSTCRKRIAWYDNLPLISWFWLGGRCRKCGAPFSFRYWVVEFLNAALWLMVWRQFQYKHGGLFVAACCVMVSMLIVGTFIDFDFYIIPDRITLGLVVVGFLFSILVPALHPKPDWFGMDWVGGHAAWLRQLSPRMLATLFSFLGIISGGLLLLLIVEGGKLAFGRLKIQFPKPTTVVIGRDKIKFEDEEIPFEEIFFRASDRIRFKAATTRFKGHSFENADVKVSEDKLWVNEQEFELKKIGRVEATTDRLIIPREAMGLGDVKLMAGVGAFVGPAAVFWVLMISALLGSLVGVALVVLRMRQFQGKIPYGPYIALGAVIWIFAGRDLVEWFYNVVGPVMQQLIRGQ